MSPLSTAGKTAAALPAETWSNSAVAELILSGLAVVMGVLLLLFILTSLMGRIFVALEAARSRKEEEAFAAKTAATLAAEKERPQETDPALIAVLAAAAAESLQSDVRIVKIRQRPDLGGEWAVQGRMSIHSSHQLRKGGHN